MKSPMRVQTQLMALGAVFVGLLCVVAGLGIYESLERNKAMLSMYEDRVVPLKQLKSIADMYAVNMVDTAHKYRDGALSQEEALKAMADAKSVVDAEWQAYTGNNLVPQERVLVTKFEAAREVTDASAATLEQLIANGDREGLARYTADQMYPGFDPLQGVIGDLIQVQLDVSKQVHDDGEDQIGFLIALNGAVLCLSLLIGTAGVLFFSRRLQRQLGGEPHEVSAVARAIADGDLSHEIRVPSHAGNSVMAAMGQMASQLNRLVGRVRENAEQVATASSQIATGNHDLSQRTEEQASALQQTAASMEQIGSTVKNNSDNAEEASRLAVQTTNEVVTGGEVVGNVVQTMRGIEESSRRINDIIGVIDGIAFQTNILALNAAVEAARAGEQGRGFAVVAGEVRTLAQRSAAAAKEIKELISASVGQVEQGTALVDQAGETMSRTVESVQRLRDLVAEISHASREQATGMGQVGQAVSQMDQTTQQNAALVEESAAAASSLRDQSELLVQAVSVFKTRQMTLN
ncbi:methyl-accepting chemotaxis protein [Hydrogenophaga sp. 5NK40-0174]|uniref:methyl-accepting chemotaxis protein n=1 Tax=Hydrogenophaga sp. 5NK40-0174 TaxID=3127649 RepID=UPI003104361B